VIDGIHDYWLFVLTGLGFAWGDSAAAVAVAVMISILGLRLGRSTIETLLDRERGVAVGQGGGGVVGHVSTLVDVARLTRDLG